MKDSEMRVLHYSFNLFDNFDETLVGGEGPEMFSDGQVTQLTWPLTDRRLLACKQELVQLNRSRESR